MKPDDYRLLVKPSSPALAPDGKRAALVVSHTVWDDNRTVDDLVLVDLQTKAQTTIVHEGKDLSDPAFSPDGSQARLSRATPEPATTPMRKST